MVGLRVVKQDINYFGTFLDLLGQFFQVGTAALLGRLTDCDQLALFRAVALVVFERSLHRLHVSIEEHPGAALDGTLLGTVQVPLAMEAVRGRTRLDPIREVPDLPVGKQRRVAFGRRVDVEVGEREKTVSECRHSLREVRVSYTVPSNPYPYILPSAADCGSALVFYMYENFI